MVILDPLLDPWVRALFAIHVTGGAIALAIFMVPLLSRKGSRLHVRTGRIYVYAMSAVALAAFPITLWRIFLDPARDAASRSFAAFLIFIAAFTLASVVHGVRVLRAKSRTAPDLRPQNLALPLLLAVTALGTMLLGHRLGHGLLQYFPLLGLATAASQLWYWLRAPKEPRHWWYAHMEAMIAASIATVTAFLFTALPRLVPGIDSTSLALWLAPTLVGVPVLNLWTMYYKRKFRRR